MRINGLRSLALLSAILMFGAVAFAAAPEPSKAPVPAQAAPAAETPKAPAPSPAAAPSSDAAKAVEAAIERAADKASPAVVNITILREISEEMLQEEFGDMPDWPPEDLKPFLDRLRRRGRPPMRAQGNGSGVVISPDGFILTSEHVVRDASEIEVTLANRKKFKAAVVGSDPRRDLAVIRIQAQGLSAAELGDAATLRRGQFVLALGSPFGFGRDGQASLSFGIVSGTGRAIPGIGRELDRYYGNLIQTDAAVNPGNSGGPLVDLDGKVVGVNAVISSQTGMSNGVGFAVPITAQTRGVIERLKKGEEIVYGYVGVEIQEVGADEAKESGAELGAGAFVARVLADAPGAKAGIRPGDVIVAVNNRPVRDPDDVIQMVQETTVGGKVTLTVLRKGKRENLSVEVGRRPAPRDVLATRESGEWWRGMRIEPLTEELKVQTGLKPADQGAFVREVRDGSPAADAGIVPGMVIDQVGDKKVAGLKEFHDAVASVQGPCIVHIIGIGVKVIQPPGAATPDKSVPDRSKGGKSPRQRSESKGEKSPSGKPDGESQPQP